jgi:hypothetical protein
MLRAPLLQAELSMQASKADGPFRAANSAYARASRLLTDLAYQRPPRGVLIPRALRASTIW